MLIALLVAVIAYASGAHSEAGDMAYDVAPLFMIPSSPLLNPFKLPVIAIPKLNNKTPASGKKLSAAVVQPAVNSGSPRSSSQDQELPFDFESSSQDEELQFVDFESTFTSDQDWLDRMMQTASDDVRLMEGLAVAGPSASGEQIWVIDDAPVDKDAPPTKTTGSSILEQMESLLASAQSMKIDTTGELLSECGKTLFYIFMSIGGVRQLMSYRRGTPEEKLSLASAGSGPTHTATARSTVDDAVATATLTALAVASTLEPTVSTPYLTIDVSEAEPAVRTEEPWVKKQRERMAKENNNNNNNVFAKRGGGGGGGGGSDEPLKNRVISCLPYCLPLMDGLRYTQPMFSTVPYIGNVFAVVFSPVILVYSVFPLAGLIAFFYTSSKGRDMNTPKFIRFNCQQAVILDITLFLVNILGTLSNLGDNSLAKSFPPELGTACVNTVFWFWAATISYSVIQNLRGIKPDQIPGISISADIQSGM